MKLFSFPTRRRSKGDPPPDLVLTTRYPSIKEWFTERWAQSPKKSFVEHKGHAFGDPVDLAKQEPGTIKRFAEAMQAWDRWSFCRPNPRCRAPRPRRRSFAADAKTAARARAGWLALC